jgi:DNA mismatch repair ATPase MutL
MSSTKIKVLPKHLVDKIAAGEVIVRPVNAVKELIENSIDAGSTEITVVIKNGGLDIIKIQVRFRFCIVDFTMMNRIG